MKQTDIDIDFADRLDILSLIRHTSAMQLHNDEPRPHNSGVYVTDIPYDPLINASSLDYKLAEERGYFKIDFLNVSVYKMIKDQQHYDSLLSRPTPWEQLNDKEFIKQLIHINNHGDLMNGLVIDSIPRMAMFLALIRPGKRHLVGRPWDEIAKEIWIKPDDDIYYFKQSHAISYAVLVTLHMKLLDVLVKSTN